MVSFSSITRSQKEDDALDHIVTPKHLATQGPVGAEQNVQRSEVPRAQEQTKTISKQEKRGTAPSRGMIIGFVLGSTFWLGSYYMLLPERERLLGDIEDFIDRRRRKRNNTAPEKLDERANREEDLIFLREICLVVAKSLDNVEEEFGRLSRLSETRMAEIKAKLERQFNPRPTVVKAW